MVSRSTSSYPHAHFVIMLLTPDLCVHIWTLHMPSHSPVIFGLGWETRPSFVDRAPLHNWTITKNSILLLLAIRQIPEAVRFFQLEGFESRHNSNMGPHNVCGVVVHWQGFSSMILLAWLHCSTPLFSLTKQERCGWRPRGSVWDILFLIWD